MQAKLRIEQDMITPGLERLLRRIDGDVSRV